MTSEPKVSPTRIVCTKAVKREAGSTSSSQMFGQLQPGRLTIS